MSPAMFDRWYALSQYPDFVIYFTAGDRLDTIAHENKAARAIQQHTWGKALLGVIYLVAYRSPATGVWQYRAIRARYRVPSLIPSSIEDLYDKYSRSAPARLQAAE